MNLNQENFKYELLDRIRQIRPIYRESDTQYAIRCPLCGDSRRDRKKTRFYIKIDVNNPDLPVLYNCFNCGEGGLLTPTILKSLDIADMNLLSGMQAFNKKVMKNYKGYAPKSRKLHVKIPKVDETNPDNLLKKKYIEERLGISLSFEELYQFKTVFRLGDFLMQNNINTLTVSGEKAMDIHENYVGFLTVNNETINARLVLSNRSKGKRYEKYSLFKDQMGRLKFYSIPRVIDTMTKDTIYINIAEGVFDIYGVYFHIDKELKPNSLYIAACGSAYRSIIEYFIREGFICNVVLNIYADTDQDLEIYRNLKREYGIWFEEFNVYTNELEKDFGVRADQIKVVKNKV